MQALRDSRRPPVSLDGVAVRAAGYTAKACALSLVQGPSSVGPVAKPVTPRGVSTAVLCGAVSGVGIRR
jgi:hypothetical protein